MSDVLGSLADDLRDPGDGTQLVCRHPDHLRFAGGREYPVVDGVALLIAEETSLFRHADLIARPLVQDRWERDPRRLKNFVRQRLLPQLGRDRDRDDRYRRLAQHAAPGPILVLGAGDKVGLYREIFAPAPVVTSDVHLLFGADMVVDAHRIPFRDELFQLVLAAQVLEHTVRPWQVAAEVERVLRPGGVAQIEVPFLFPWHGQPYDFHRFTPSGLRFLFPRCELVELSATEGAGAATATLAAQLLLAKVRGRTPRRVALVLGRLFFWWLPILDRLPSHHPPLRLTAPRALAATYRKDGRRRSDSELLSETMAWCSR